MMKPFPIFVNGFFNHIVSYICDMFKIILLSLLFFTKIDDTKINLVNAIPNDTINNVIEILIPLLDVKPSLIFAVPIKETVINAFIKKHNKKLSGFIIPGDNIYTIYIDTTLTGDDLIEVLCHEMIHLKQLQSKKLELINNNFKWNGNFIYENTPYDHRPWEVEAYRKQRHLKKMVKEKL